MCAKRMNHRPGYLWSLLHNKCSRCRSGDMFQTKNAYNLRQFMKMNDKCPLCGQYMEIEPGFYYGTSYVSYVLTGGFSPASFRAWVFFIGFFLHDNRLFWWIGVNIIALILLQPYLMRLS